MSYESSQGSASHKGGTAGGDRKSQLSSSASSPNQPTASTPGPGLSNTGHCRMETNQYSLIDEIRFISTKAAELLQKKRLTTNFEIKRLSDEELKQLFPKDKNLELRGQIKELIKIFKQGKNELKREDDMEREEDLKARCERGEEEILKKEDMISKQCDLIPSQSGHRAGTEAGSHTETGDGTSLMDQICHISGDAARALQEAEFTTDSEIQGLTRVDLNELFPGLKNLKLRKAISEVIQKSKQVHIVVNTKNPEKHSDEHMRADLSPNDASEESVKEQMNKVMNFLHHLESVVSSHNAAFGECLTALKEMKELLRASCHQSESGTENNTEAAGKSTSKWSFPKIPISIGWPSSAPTSDYYKPCKQMKRAVVKVHCVVSGRTLGSHQTLLQQVKDQGGLELQETNNPDTCDVIILFCPIVSRMGTDIEAAMKLVPVVGNKALIRVVLHHTFNEEFTVPHVSADSRVMYDVSAVFHDTQRGLLQCQINNRAVQQIHSALLKYRSTGQPQYQY